MFTIPKSLKLVLIMLAFTGITELLIIPAPTLPSIISNLFAAFTVCPLTLTLTLCMPLAKPIGTLKTSSVVVADTGTTFKPPIVTKFKLAVALNLVPVIVTTDPSFPLIGVNPWIDKISDPESALPSFFLQPKLKISKLNNRMRVFFIFSKSNVKCCNNLPSRVLNQTTVTFSNFLEWERIQIHFTLCIIKYPVFYVKYLI